MNGMPVKIPWDRYEVALLFRTYERIENGNDFNAEAAYLSNQLRELAILRGFFVDDTFRNTNGIKMQLANVQYVFTNGEKGLSGASTLIREMHQLYKSNPSDYQAILKEAIRLNNEHMSIEEAFFAYAKEKSSYSPDALKELLHKATLYCHLKRPLLGMTDIALVRDVQQKVASGKLLRFQYGKASQDIRTATQLYYSFVKNYEKELKADEIEADEIEAEEVMRVEPTIKQNQSSQTDESKREKTASLESFKLFLLGEQHLAERTAGNYCTSLRMIEDYLQRNNLPFSIIDSCESNVQDRVAALMKRPDFVEINNQRHHQYSAALAQLIAFLCQRSKPIKDVNYNLPPVKEIQKKNKVTIKDAVCRVLTEAGEPLTVQEILSRIDAQGLYHFNTDQPLNVLRVSILRLCRDVSISNHAKEDLFERLTENDGIPRFRIIGSEETDKNKLASPLHSALSKTDKQVLEVVAEGFPHGIRPASIIDLNKVKRLYFAKYSEEISSGMNISELLNAEGLIIGEKVYIYTDEQKQSLRDLINSILLEGYEVIYYSELFHQHNEILESFHLYEAPQMRAVFSKLLPNVICKAELMLLSKNSNEIEEITRAFGENIVLSYQQIKERCPYLTMEAIRWYLSKSDRFVWSSPETFAQTDLIQLDPQDVQSVIQQVLPQIKTEGYYSLARLSLEESCAQNPLVSTSAVRDAMFIRYMASSCDRHGLIATSKGVTVTSAQLLEGWCKGLDRLTIRELEEYERELTGHHAVLGIWAACHTMVRIDHDNFVSDTLIDFDVDAVDRAIALFVRDRVISISAITSFTSFPDVSGYTWNLFLVESFLRRFSKRFSIDGGPAQMSYVGGICSIEKQFSCYEDRMAYAVVQDGVTLTEESIGKYLTERKFILRRSDVVRKVLEKARFLKEM